MKHDIQNSSMLTSNPGKSLFLLGQSLDGPINSPIAIASLEEAQRTFGEGNLVDAYRQVESMPDITVYLMRISGEYARMTLLGQIGEESVPVLKFRSVHGGDVYNGIHIYTRDVERGGVLQKALIIESPVEGVSGISYILADYQSISALVYDINQDARLRRGLVYAATDYPMDSLDVLGDLNETPTAMMGGENGMELTKDDLYIALDKSYSILEGREVDVICPYPARFDDTHPAFHYGDATYGNATYGSRDYLALVDAQYPDRPLTFHEQLIDFCRNQERFGIHTHGVIGLTEIQDLSTKEPFYISRLLKETAFQDRYGMMEYINGKWIDKGYYISVAPVSV